MNALSALAEQLRRGEHERLELKSQFHLPAIAQTVVAFLNSQGGMLLVGVKEDGSPVGLKQAQAAKRQLDVHLQQHVAPSASWSVTVEEHQGLQYLVVDVPPGSHYPYITDNTIYVRRGPQTSKANPDDLSVLFARGQRVSERWERQLAAGWTLDDLDEQELKRTKEALEIQLPSAQHVSTHTELLAKLQVSDDEQLLNSAVVLFAARPQQRLPQTRVRTAVLIDERGEQMRDNRVLEGHAFALFRQILKFLEDNLPTTSNMHGMVREDRYVLPRFVLREAVLNALVHRDYAAFNGSVAVTLFQDRLEIWNPGPLPEALTPRTIAQGHVSLPRNPDLAHVFYVRGLVERLGLGARRIVEECKNAGLPKPIWQEVGGGVRLTLALMKSGTRTMKGSRYIPTELSLRAVHFLETTPVGSTIDLETYRGRFAPEVSTRTARRDLEALLAQGHLRVRGKDQGRVYERVEPTPEQ